MPRWCCTSRAPARVPLASAQTPRRVHAAGAAACVLDAVCATACVFDAVCATACVLDAVYAAA